MSQERYEQIRRLFGEAMELAPEERPAWLDQVCADDSALRREIESLLEAFDAHGSNLGQALELIQNLPDMVPALYSEVAFTTDPVGREIAHYRVLERLGSGGMGVVYKAQDTRLKRMVALKFLPPALMSDPEAKKRFIHEAQAASALDHPNICTIHEINESEEGHLFIVMAMIEGETLKKKLARRPLPIPEAIDIARQVARGLAHAHERGIVHRDIKPANVMVVDRGRVKIVDFGLAKVAEVSLTQTGMTLGTMAYMSPEQIQGGAVDLRTDIWALGVLIYEMVTGQRPFKGTRNEGLAYAIEHSEPEPMTALRSGVPIALEDIVSKALAKDPADRYQHVDEIPVDLRALSTPSTKASKGSTSAGRTTGEARPMLWKTALIGAFVGILVVAISVLIWISMHSESRDSSTTVRFTVTLPVGQKLSTWYQPIALSPDGTQLVYSAWDGDTTRLYRRAIDRLETDVIPGTEDARDPFFSPDGRWIGFFAEGKLQKVQVTGGIPQPICEAPKGSWGASWGPDDTIIVSLGFTSGLLQVPAAGGTPEALTIPNTGEGEVGHYWPQYLPEGRGVLFSIWSGSGWRTAILPSERHTWNVLLEEGAAAQYLPTGHLVYAQMSSAVAAPALLAVPFDISRHEVTGTAVSVLEHPGLSGPNFAVSTTGTLVYVASGSVWVGLEENTLVWVDRTGHVAPFFDQRGSYQVPRFSPDGTRLSVTDISQAGSVDIWIYDVERGTRTRFTKQGTVNNYSAWTPDGERITFTSARFPAGLYWKSADGNGEAEQLLPRKQHIRIPGTWSLDGKKLAFTEHNLAANSDIWLFSLDDGASVPLLVTSGNEASPRFSPNGRYIAYSSDATGDDEVYVRSYPESDTMLQISTSGGREPVWAADGRTLFYRQGDAMMAVAIETETRLTAGRPEQLFEGNYLSNLNFGASNYDVSPDGRFLMIQPIEVSTPTQLHVVVNWLTELEALVPSDK